MLSSTFIEVGGDHGAEAVAAVQLQQQRARHARVDHVAAVHAVPAIGTTGVTISASMPTDAQHAAARLAYEVATIDIVQTSTPERCRISLFTDGRSL